MIVKKFHLKNEKGIKSKKYRNKLEIKKYENKLENKKAWKQFKDGAQGLYIKQKLILAKEFAIPILTASGL